MTKIEWCDATVNPLGHWCFGPSGTKENPRPCVYCYAKKMARRGMNGCDKCQSFNVPHTHFEQLDKLTSWKKLKNVFMQSMGDLFHNDVPDEWIREVFKACEAAPQHRYLFLTKNPSRYTQNPIYNLAHGKYNRWWFGTTITCQKDYDERAWKLPLYRTCFLSIEPLHEEISLNELRIMPVKLVIVGAETGNRKGKVIPKREWIENIVNECRRSNVPVFMKNSLAPIWGEPLVQEYPWGDKP